MLRSELIAAIKKINDALMHAHISDALRSEGEKIPETILSAYSILLSDLSPLTEAESNLVSVQKLNSLLSAEWWALKMMRHTENAS
jgi:hypothetical protein